MLADSMLDNTRDMFVLYEPYWRIISVENYTGKQEDLRECTLSLLLGNGTVTNKQIILLIATLLSISFEDKLVDLVDHELHYLI
ncbi:hypothetical protein CF8_0007 [Aeromonas phage CF8]|nr:hypothetical protein CF8_0007 [Aeromonas phage CF8]